MQVRGARRSLIKVVKCLVQRFVRLYLPVAVRLPSAEGGVMVGSASASPKSGNWLFRARASQHHGPRAHGVSEESKRIPKNGQES